MKTFKFHLVLLAVIGLVISSCNKEEPVLNDPEISKDMAFLSFGPVLNDIINRAALKQQISDLPACSDSTPAFAQLSITYGDSDTPVDLIVEILSDENGFFTAYDKDLEIPIPSGSSTVTVTLTDFLVWNDNAGSPGEIIWAAPKAGSEYAALVDQPLPATWDLTAGSKTYVDIPVLCFDDRQVNLYGYLFFDIIPTEVSTLCFFANYCNIAGRHYTANYSLDLYLGTSNSGVPLYLDQTPTTGNDEEFYADPICLAVPSPQNGIGDDDPYLYYEITLTDWPNNYGTAGDYVETGTLTWNEVQGLLNNDGTTADYKHIYINCEDTGGEGEDTNVMIIVDTENINENNLDETVYFLNEGSTTISDSSKPQDHIALVDKNKKIYWSGKPLNENSNETIEILEVYRKEFGGERILVRTYIDQDLEGVVVGDIRATYVDGFELYNLVFKIHGETERTFTVDPKLQMKTD